MTFLRVNAQHKHILQVLVHVIAVRPLMRLRFNSVHQALFANVKVLANGALEVNSLRYILWVKGSPISYFGAQRALYIDIDIVQREIGLLLDYNHHYYDNTRYSDTCWAGNELPHSSSYPPPLPSCLPFQPSSPPYSPPFCFDYNSNPTATQTLPLPCLQ